MSRKVRMGVVAAAATAVFFYLAAGYALHHPESLLTQCVVTTFHLGTDHNPFFKVGQSVGRTAYRIAQVEVVGADMTSEEEEQLWCVPEEPLPIQDAPPEATSVISSEQRDFIIRTIQEQLAAVHVPRDSHTSSRLLPMPRFAEPELCAPPPLDQDDFPSFMPHCSDEDDSSALANKTKSSSDPLFQFWLGLFESVAKEDVDMNGAEPQEAAQETSHYFHDEEPPQCLEDPAYQHQYPGCPYTEKCPRLEESGQPKKIDIAPSAKPKNSKKTPSGVRQQEDQLDLPRIDPGKYELPARLRQLLPGDSTESEEEQSHPEVDTMEFRPSDARQGEFDPKAM
ncbi:MAG TPA: hypothetical protein VGX70_17215 [Gemmataceae bacterium]|nr:hypothetical protein [Gemmataceae bacterium]